VFRCPHCKLLVITLRAKLTAGLLRPVQCPHCRGHCTIALASIQVSTLLGIIAFLLCYFSVPRDAARDAWSLFVLGPVCFTATAISVHMFGFPLVQTGSPPTIASKRTRAGFVVMVIAIATVLAYLLA
jgi:hypothetical protein